MYGIQLACQRLSSSPGEEERLVLCDSQQVKVHFRWGALCEQD